MRFKLEQRKLSKYNKSSRVHNNSNHFYNGKQINRTIENEKEFTRLEHIPRDDQPTNYISHKGKFKDKYIKFGGLGANKDERWNIISQRRQNMLEFSDNVNGTNNKIIKL